MLRNIVEVRHLDGYRLFLRFDDGISGEIDLSELINFDGVFAPLKDVKYFSRVAVHEELRTIYWPNGVDLDPVVLYYRIKGEALPTFKKTEAAS